MRGVAAKRWNTVETNRSGLNSVNSESSIALLCPSWDITVPLHGHLHGRTDPEIMHDHR
jgi:regulatory protein YycI of two-component signal transduction system YycFG